MPSRLYFISECFNLIYANSFPSVIKPPGFHMRSKQGYVHVCIYVYCKQCLKINGLYYEQRFQIV